MSTSYDVKLLEVLYLGILPHPPPKDFSKVFRIFFYARPGQRSPVQPSSASGSAGKVFTITAQAAGSYQSFGKVPGEETCHVFPILQTTQKNKMRGNKMRENTMRKSGFWGQLRQHIEDFN